MPDSKAAILLVDDRPEKLLALEAVLEDLNQQIVRAYSGREALRHVLSQDFAVILLDVNMPGMDGFETATLIRQRASSRHTPIIFITAFGDEMHAARGYSLGAVDYILAPVVPDVLRTKVAVFVDLFNKTQQTQRQAETLRRRAVQLQKLAAASLAINSALSTEGMLRTITDTARDIVGAHQAITLYLPDAPMPPPPPGPSGQSPRPQKTVAVGSFSDKYIEWRDRELKLDVIATTLVAQSRSATRMTETDLHDHPDWDIVRTADLPAVVGGMLAAPLTGRDGTNLGIIYLSDRFDGDFFTHDDEAVLVQLAQMGSIAIENTIYAQEREANRLKDEFLATLSHELRTPLNAILGWTQLLKMESLKADVAHGLDVIDRNARAQTKLIEDLLDVSRITTGKLRLNMRRSTFGPVVQAAVDAARPAADAKQVRIDVKLADDEIPVSIDPDRIQQVVWNLLTNAVKFTPAGGQITVDLARIGPPGGERVTLKVTDSGQGIDPKFLPFVFDRFRQADSTSTRAHGGLGIGLTIVRHIVELHGGSVAADSAGIGRGATFTVELPAAGQVPATLTTTAGADGASASSQSSQKHSISGVRVLLVDDDPDARDVIAATLRRAGADVTTVSSALEALDTLPGAKPDVLISDIAMPDHDGYALIRRIRQLPNEDGGEVPAIALTAYAREEDRARALDAGFQVHLAKPVDPGDLLARIAHLAAQAAGQPVLRLA
jgi:signal transduction histidine kinase/DNA-binding response OmpR family regulator